jgi:hypothetical protein
MKESTCRIGRVSQLAPDLLLVDIDQSTAIEMEHVYEFKRESLKIMNGRKWYSIVNYGAYSLPTAEAREKCGLKEANNHVLGRAVVVNDMGQMILAKHILKRYTLKTPVKIFTQMESARDWIENLKANKFENQIVG